MLQNQMTDFFPTRAALEAGDMAARLAGCGPEAGVLFGPPGSGRSALLAELARRQPAALLVSCPPGLGSVGFLRTLLEPLAPLVRLRDGRTGLRTVAAILRSRSVRLLLIDDAHHLYKPPLEMVRELVELAPVAVLLAGPERELRRRLKRVPCLQDLVGRWRSVGPLSADEVEEYLELQSGLRLPRRHVVRLARAAHRLSGGNWSRLLRLLARCREKAAARFSPSLHPDDARVAPRDWGLEEVA
jgi:hypothetical protein